MSAIGFLAGFDEPVQRLAHAEPGRLIKLLGKAVSRARRGTESVTLALTIEEAGPCGEAWKSGDFSPWVVLLGDHLATMVRPEDELVQVDRREFVLILEGTQAENAPAVVRRVRAAVRDLAASAGENAQCLSVRFAVVPVTGTRTPSEILSQLDGFRAGARSRAEGAADTSLCDSHRFAWGHRGHPVRARSVPLDP